MKITIKQNTVNQIERSMGAGSNLFVSENSQKTGQYTA